MGNNPENWVDPLGLAPEDAISVWQGFVTNPNSLQYGVARQKSMWNPTPVYGLPFTEQFKHRLLYQDSIGIDVGAYSNDQLACEYQSEVRDQLALVGMAAGILSGGGYGGPPQASLTVDDIMANPNLLSGRTPGNISIPSNWRVGTLGKGAHQGQGWAIREYTAGGQPTGRMIRWHPGGGHHGPRPYWRGNDFNTKSGIIR